MASERPLDAAAQELEKRLRSFRWFLSTGVGNTADGEALFVYVRSKNHRELREIEKGWKGHRVIIRAVGSIRPVSRSKRNRVAA